jgi:hypothetical protein
VPEKYIYGTAFFSYWKPSGIGFLEHGAYENAPPPVNNKEDLRADDER